MRRTDRQLSEAETIDVLNTAEYGILSAVTPDGTPYGVPLSYAYQDGCIYIHCTADGGLKIDCLRQNSRVCFTAVTGTELLPEKFSTKYRSAICVCTAELLTARKDKLPGITAILARYAPQHMERGLSYIDRAIDDIFIIKLHIESMTGKARK